MMKEIKMMMKSTRSIHKGIRIKIIKEITIKV